MLRCVEFFHSALEPRQWFIGAAATERPFGPGRDTACVPDTRSWCRRRRRLRCVAIAPMNTITRAPIWNGIAPLPIPVWISTVVFN